MTAETTEYPPAYQRPDGLWVFSRPEFAARRFWYKPGEHVVFGGPTQRAGKTTMAFFLLDYVATPDLPAYVAVSKPTDKVTAAEGKRLGFRRVDDWPPPKKLSEYWDGPPRGYLVWPRFGNLETDVARCTDITARLLADRYTSGVKGKQGMLVIDDTVTKSKVMGLDREMTTIIAMSGAMGIALWVFVQKPTDSGRTALWGYENAEHVFLSHTGEKRARLRYDEIGGMDDKIVYNALGTLEPYQFLYLKRKEGFICVVDSK